MKLRIKKKVPHLLRPKTLLMESTVFYTFMGINVIRKGWVDKAKFQPPGFMGAISGMSGVATWMMKEKLGLGVRSALDSLSLLNEPRADRTPSFQFMVRIESHKMRIFAPIDPTKM